MEWEASAAGAEAPDPRPDSELADLAGHGDHVALAALLARHGDALLRFCCVVLGEVHGKQPFSKELFSRTVARAAEPLLAGTAPDDLKPWLFKLAYEEAPGVRELMGSQPRIARLRGVLPARGAGVLLSRLRRLSQGERATVVLAEVESFGADKIGAIVGLSGDSVIQIVGTARQALTQVATRTGPECKIIRQALAQDEIAPLAQRAVSRHLEHCAPCRAVAEGGAALSANLKEALGKLSVVAVPFLLREGLARANVGGPSGSSGSSAASREASRRAAAAARHARYLRRRSMAAAGVAALIVLVAVLIASTGRLNQDNTRSAAQPWVVPSFLVSLSFDDLIPNGSPPPKPCTGANCAPGPCAGANCAPATCPDGSPAPCNGSPVCADGSAPPCNGSPACADGTAPPCNGSPMCADGTAPPCNGSPVCADGSAPPCNIPVVACADGSAPPCADGPGGVRCADGSSLPCTHFCPARTVPPDCHVEPVPCPPGTAGTAQPDCHQVPPPTPVCPDGSAPPCREPARCPADTIPPDCHPPPKPCPADTVEPDCHPVPPFVPLPDLCDDGNHQHGGHHQHHGGDGGDERNHGTHGSPPPPAPQQPQLPPTDAQPVSDHSGAGGESPAKPSPHPHAPHPHAPQLAEPPPAPAAPEQTPTAAVADPAPQPAPPETAPAPEPQPQTQPEPPPPEQDGDEGDHRQRHHGPQRPDPGNGYPQFAVEAQGRLRTKRRWQLDVA